jgi:pilus assembly protein CpaB
MNGKSIIMLVLAVALGLGAMVATMTILKRPRPEVPVEETQDILVASRDYKEEEILKPDMVTTIRKNKKDVPPGAFTAFKDVEERWVKTVMMEGDVIVDKKLGPKGSPPGLVANIPPGMRAHAVEVSEQSGVSGFILPGHRVDVIRFEPGERSQLRAETILQNILVLAAGQVFTRPEEKALQNRTVTLAVTPDQVETLVAARAKGPLSLSLRGVNDHAVVQRPKPKPELSDEERQQREKLQKELAEVKLALAKKLAEQPPPPPPAVVPEPKQPELRWVYIYRPLLDKRDREYPERVGVTDAARKLAQQTTPEDDEQPRGFGFGASAGSSLSPKLPSAPGRNP